MTVNVSAMVVGVCTEGWLVTRLVRVDFRPHDELPAGQGDCEQCRGSEDCERTA